jgi:hypothetical protein
MLLLLLLLPLALQGLGAWANFAHQTTNLGTPEVDSFVKAAIFATLTNVSSFNAKQQMIALPSSPRTTSCCIASIRKHALVVLYSASSWWYG